MTIDRTNYVSRNSIDIYFQVVAISVDHQSTAPARFKLHQKIKLFVNLFPQEKEATDVPPLASL